MEKVLIPLIAGIILFFGVARKARKESKQRDIINKSNTQASTDTTDTTTASDLNKNLKTGDALNFNSYDIPEYKGYHFEIGKGYVKNKRQDFDSIYDLNPASGLPLVGLTDIAGNTYGSISGDSSENDRRVFERM